MKNFFLILAAGTVLALGFVHQQIVLIRLGYQVEAQARVRDDLLDQHRMLHYNVLTLRSPVILKERLAQRQIELVPPRTVEILAPPFRAVPATSPAALGSARSLGPAWLRGLFRLAAAWLGGGPQAVAEPAREGR